MPTIVEYDAATVELLSSALGSRATSVSGLDSLKQHLSSALDEYAVILGPSVDLEAAAALADTLRVTRPATSVILIRRRVDTRVLAEALRSGMREVIEERDLNGLSAAVRKAAEVWQAVHGTSAASADDSTGRIVTVFSPKGGVGKTTLAVNLALALSDSGARRVCIVDLDLAFGDIAITLQLFPTHTMADLAGMTETLDGALLKTILIPFRDELQALAAPVQPDAKDAISARLVGRVLHTLKAQFDYVVVDTAPAFDEYTLQAFDETDEALLVTTLDVPTIKNVKIALETLDLLNFPMQRRRLILNRADDSVGLSGAKVEEALGMKIMRTLPTSSQVASATNAGEPIVLSNPRHPVSQAITAIAQQLAGDDASQATTAKEPAHAAPSRRGFLRRNRSLA